MSAAQPRPRKIYPSAVGRLMITTAITLLTTFSMAACGPTEIATITNGCGHTVDAWAGRVGSESPEDEIKTDVFRDSPQRHSYPDGTTRELHVGPGEAFIIMVIVYGEDSTKVTHFGEPVTDSNDYTITGDMCLTPAEEG